MIKVINVNLQEHKQMNRGEFLCFQSIWLLMSAIGGGFNKIDYWLNTLPSAKNEAVHRFNKWMLRYCFRDIMHAIWYTDEESPPYRDKFYGVRKLITIWNDNIAHMFWPG